MKKSFVTLPPGFKKHVTGIYLTASIHHLPWDSIKAIMPMLEHLDYPLWAFILLYPVSFIILYPLLSFIILYPVSCILCCILSGKQIQTLYLSPSAFHLFKAWLTPFEYGCPNTTSCLRWRNDRQRLTERPKSGEPSSLSWTTWRHSSNTSEKSITFEYRSVQY